MERGRKYWRNVGKSEIFALQRESINDQRNVYDVFYSKFVELSDSEAADFVGKTTTN